MEDYGVSLSRKQMGIIHNGIDTDFFSYKQKTAGDRLKLLAVGPYSTPKYARDLLWRAIAALSGKPFFGELRITVAGEGEAWERDTAELRKFANVRLINRFLNRAEIKELHDSHGIFLAPTRWDSQGVSRDEARASGLVAVTNDCSAIPEFCKDRVDAMLAPAESAEGIAKAVEELYGNPELFLKISESGAERVKTRLAEDITLSRGGGSWLSLSREFSPMYSVIHNEIDTDGFAYVAKPAEQRKRILAVRPWSNRKYANDIAVRAVLELAKYNEFTDMEFLFVGRGEMWDELTAPLRRYPNVKLRNEFLTHAEIAGLHRQYGVFLVPTRMDSQGVSRDEAMSSGLVAVTNAVAAIPEFCSDGEDSLLAPGEDWLAVAEAVLRLYRDPELFLRLSENAAGRVRRQSAEDLVISREIELIRRR
jgi:glycosyltransferase involved in cell wall biosynthesis